LHLVVRGYSVLVTPFFPLIHGFLRDLDEAPKDAPLPVDIWLKRSHDAQAHSFPYRSHGVVARCSTHKWD
jgi:hypothetical protein